MQHINTLLEQVASELPQGGLSRKLAQAVSEQRPLNIKLGFDPTAPDLHLGHAVVLKKLQQFQELGHQLTIVVGSFTARIGDPTGKNKSRQPLSPEEVTRNAQTYIDQLGKVIDVSTCRIVFNGDWLDELDFAEVIQLLSKVTVAQLLHRNDFNKRFAGNIPIALHELVYPVLQGFDSVQIKADVEMGGTDQLFNCTMGRQLQEAFDIDPQIVLCMPLLRGLDGKEKMSKSLNNYIALTDAPQDMFGKTMSIPDLLIPEYIDLTTSFSGPEKQLLKTRLDNGENPMHLKKIVAENLVLQYHGVGEAMAAAQHFADRFQQQRFEEKPFDLVSIASLGITAYDLSLLDLCALLRSSDTRTALRRLIADGGITIDNSKRQDPHERIPIRSGMKIKLGKQQFIALQ